MDDMLTVAQGTFRLRRPRPDPSGSLRAWDAADEYVLDHLATVAPGGERWLVVNDGFGALATAAAASGHLVSSWGDSSIALTAAAHNLTGNELDPTSVRFVPSTQEPDGPIDVVVVKVPRVLAHLDDQLRRLRPLLHVDSIVIGAGMTRSVHRSTIEAFASILGPTPTSRARKKARLLLTAFDPDLEPATGTGPPTWTTPDGLVVASAPNVFSAGKLDHGTRLLLEHLPRVRPGATVLDLGCGSGVVAATVAHRNDDVGVVCCDESYQAIAAARRTVGSVTERAEFHVTDGLDGIADGSIDLVLVNPPFHAGGARTSEVAERMIVDARRVLRPGGEVRVVANRHLNHHETIRSAFGDVEVVASNPRFVVLSGTAP